jgi:hypothetical protein
MTPEDRKPFLEIVIGFAELKGKQLSAPALELYWNAMQHWTIEEFSQGAQALLLSCAFMPTPKDFEDLRRAAEPTAAEAWEQLGTGDATPRAIRAAEIASNGRYIGHLDIERELPHVMRRFMDIYRELTDVEQTRQAAPQIAAPRSTNGLQRLGEIKLPSRFDA